MTGEPGPGLPRITLLPAVDVAAGRAVQVVDGGPEDPYAVAMGWVDQGAEWIHLVDLDQAFGRGHNRELLTGLIDRLPVPVQLSGGLGEAETVARAADTGARRLVLASSMLAHADLLADLIDRHGELVVPSVDVRAGRVVSRGTSLDLGPVDQVLRDHPVTAPTVGHVLVADASRDGTRTGSDLELFARVGGLVAADVIASGGAASVEDLRALAALSDAGVRAVVLGAALYHGSFTLAQALRACR